MHVAFDARLNEDECRGDTTRTVREMEAEATAFVVSPTVGLSMKTRCGNYIHLSRGGKDTLAESVEHVQRAANILAALKPLT